MGAEAEELVANLWNLNSFVGCVVLTDAGGRK